LPGVLRSGDAAIIAGAVRDHVAPSFETFIRSNEQR